MLRVLLGRSDLLAGQLAGRDRIVAFDAGRHFAVGDALDLEWMQFAELGDLVKGERGVLDQPDGGRLGHQRSVHETSRYLDRAVAIAATRSGVTKR